MKHSKKTSKSVSCHCTIVITTDEKEHKVFVPDNFDATAVLDYYDQIFGRSWLEWSEII